MVENYIIQEDIMFFLKRIIIFSICTAAISFVAYLVIVSRTPFDKESLDLSYYNAVLITKGILIGANILADTFFAVFVQQIYLKEQS